MSQNKDNPAGPPRDDAGAANVESLLRQWGAKQATKQAKWGQALASAQTTSVGREPVPILRWAPVAAGIVLVIGAAAVVLHRPAEPRADKAAASAAAQELAVARRQVADVQEKLAAAHRELVGVQKELVALQKRQSELDATAAQLRVDRDAFKSQLAQAQTDAAAQAGKLARAAEDLRQSQAKAQELTGRLRSQQELADKIASLNDELIAVRKERDQTAVDLKAAAVQAAAMRAQQTSFFATLQRRYLSGEGQPSAVEAMTQPSSDLASRQSAVREHKLIARLAPIRKQAAPALAAVLDRAEAALTRLDGLDVRDARATAAFARMLIDTQLVRRIDGALAANPPQAAAQWLFEARLVLAGAENVG